MTRKSPHPSESGSPRLRFPSRRRLKSRAEFANVYALRQKAADNNLLVFARKNALGYTRIGLSVSRRHGNAIKRHRLRRLLREAYRLSQYHLPEGIDLILIPLPREQHDCDSLRRSLVRLVHSLSRRPGFK